MHNGGLWIYFSPKFMQGGYASGPRGIVEFGRGSISFLRRRVHVDPEGESDCDAGDPGKDGLCKRLLLLKKQGDLAYSMQTELKSTFEQLDIFMQRLPRVAARMLDENARNKPANYIYPISLLVSCQRRVEHVSVHRLQPYEEVARKSALLERRRGGRCRRGWILGGHGVSIS